MNLEMIIAITSAGMAGLLVVGALIRTKNSIDRWAFIIGMTFIGLERTCSGLMAGSLTPLAFYQWKTWQLTAVAFTPAIWLLFSLTYARSNAVEFLRKWLIALGLAFTLSLGCVYLYRPHLIIATEPLADGIHLAFRLGPAGTVLFLIQLITAILVMVNLEHTFRAAVGTVRWRIKYMLLGIGVFVLVRMFTASQSLLFRVIDPRLDLLNSFAVIIAVLLIMRTLFRARHFTLDVHPSHSVLQGSLTILLVGIYLLIVGVFAKVVAVLGGDSAFPLKALIVLVLLVLLALLVQSDQVRMYLRLFVSRHFQRPMHDYRKVWRQFNEGTVSRFEQVDYCQSVTKLVAEIFQALSVSLWVVGDQKDSLALASSTGLSIKQAQELQPTVPEALEILQFLKNHANPVDIDQDRGGWAATLRRCHPDEFHKGGSRVCVPIIANGEVLGLLLLGDRVGGIAFTEQDFDLLKSLGEHIASGLLNVKLSQRLLQTREHEAFQTMAAFFVHDLKNAASTLNLMLQNLPEHFNDPAFREDALRGVGKSVTHINRLISRLGQLRSELKIQPVETDLNEVINRTLATFSPEKDFQIVLQPGALPRLLLDQEQISKVITNLVLNAREASTGPGKLRLSTNSSGGWVTLKATDNGRGISPEFMARSLFRPFQTTKQTGIGIGMFQSKMIIEAHGGRITVESTVGEGTTFRVFLPATPLA